MEKIRFYGMVALTSFCLAGCSSHSQNKESYAEQTEAQKNASQDDGHSLTLTVSKSCAYGQTGEYLTVVPGDYLLLRKDDGLKLKIRLQLEQTMKENETVVTHPELMLLDSDEAEVVKYSTRLSLDNREKFQAFLKSPIGTEEDFLFKDEYMSASTLDKCLLHTQTIQLKNLKVESEDNVVAREKEYRDAMEDVDKAIDGCKKMMEVSNSALEMLNNL